MVVHRGLLLRRGRLLTLCPHFVLSNSARQAAAASLEHNNVEDEDVRLSLTSPYGQGDDVSQLKHRMGGMRGSLRCSQRPVCVSSGLLATPVGSPPPLKPLRGRSFYPTSAPVDEAGTTSYPPGSSSVLIGSSRRR